MLIKIFSMNVTSAIVKRSSKLNSRRYIFSFSKVDNTSKVLRQRFLDYFIKDHNHNFIRSSPVVPHHDASLAFVNAGMNQFKGILLGRQKPRYLKVANSQKCVRIGGKHNDLNVVGTDGYHHTFFEMLGNWSFGNYFKKEACELAWQLLTEVYKIDSRILYVTYFAGDKVLGLQPDYECKEIWKNIGVSEDRILPFGTGDNFWEMGTTGPCGPCTEIHVDMRGGTNRAQFVNKGLSDLTELWNIVFIQFTRNSDNSIKPLPTNHVDTGMGLERLCALLQGKLSNYDTDLFSPIFVAIHKICKNIPPYSGKYGEADWNLLDTNYRILADHARMITACLADGVIPEQNQKLRKIMRKAFSVSEAYFNVENGLLKELTNYVVEKLGCFYPEMEKNIKTIHKIVDHEEEVYRLIRKVSAAEWKKIVNKQPDLSNFDVVEMPGLVAAYKELKSLNTNSLTPQLGYKLFDTYGLDQDTIEKLSSKLNKKFDIDGFKDELQKAKARSRHVSHSNVDRFLDTLEKSQVPVTDDSYKYIYSKTGNGYNFKPLQVTILRIAKDGEVCEKVKPNIECTLVLDKSNMYTEAGGQLADRGVLELENGSRFEINDVRKEREYILHIGILKSPNNTTFLQINTQGLLKIDENLRLGNMRNHTATHLLNASLKRLKGATCQKSSKVAPDCLNLDVSIFGSKLTTDEIEAVEVDIKSVIDSNTDVRVSEIDSQELLSFDDVVMVPGEIYPETGIRLVEIATGEGFLSREPCCGTHVINTADLEDFCIVKVQSLGRTTTSIYAVTNGRAMKARENGVAALDKIADLRKSLNDNIDTKF
ncbi:alanine--tRNA ligase, mitochondrial isoform X2 [Agrilus planipennis]|uniref:Alanine--tRNA ligase n=1 Tax=Agrilus planipennis TaxID=224129 RepID=A0A7F5R6Q5_AGRPL|nr:alanine--tRNA ligase, mitochondrial isoform X2 [Agrilus planipennis]